MSSAACRQCGLQAVQLVYSAARDCVRRVSEQRAQFFRPTQRLQTAVSSRAALTGLALHCHKCDSPPAAKLDPCAPGRPSADQGPARARPLRVSPPAAQCRAGRHFRCGPALRAVWASVEWAGSEASLGQGGRDLLGDCVCWQKPVGGPAEASWPPKRPHRNKWRATVADGQAQVDDQFKGRPAGREGAKGAKGAPYRVSARAALRAARNTVTRRDCVQRREPDGRQLAGRRQLAGGRLARPNAAIIAGRAATSAATSGGPVAAAWWPGGPVAAAARDSGGQGQLEWGAKWVAKWAECERFEWLEWAKWLGDKWRPNGSTAAGRELPQPKHQQRRTRNNENIAQILPARLRQTRQAQLFGPTGLG